MTLARGDLLLVVSNGVLDALSRQRERFGMPRLSRLLLDHRGLAAADLLGLIDREIAAFTGSAEVPADRTMLLIRRLAAQSTGNDMGER